RGTAARDRRCREEFMPVLAALDRRDRVPELMDRPGLDPAEHRAALAALARINRLSRSAGVLWPPIARLARAAGRPVRVLDVATGAGDVPIRLAHEAEADGGLPITFEGCDISPTAVGEATRRAGPAVRLFAH